MAITSIGRTWSDAPNTVVITDTGSLATITAPGYLLTQASNIQALNAGNFQWATGDIAFINYNTSGTAAFGYFMVDPVAGTFTQNSSTRVNVIMNTAAVTGAYATPVQLLPAPGAGNVILVKSASIYTASTGNTAYAGGGVAHVQYDNTVHGGGTNALDGTTPAAEITAATSQIYVQYGLPTTTVLTGVTNKGIYFSNATGAFTGGTGTNISINLVYDIVPATI